MSINKSFIYVSKFRQLFPSVSPHVCQKEHIVVFLKRLDCHQLPVHSIRLQIPLVNDNAHYDFQSHSCSL